MDFVVLLPKFTFNLFFLKVVGVKGQKPTTTKKKKSIDEEIASDSDAEK